MKNHLRLMVVGTTLLMAASFLLFPTGGSEVVQPKEKVQIQVYVTTNIEEFPKGQDENNNFIADYIDETTGYDVQWSIQPKYGLREKLSLMMSSGDAPDLIQLFAERSIFADFARQGVLTPLSAILDEAGPAIKSIVPPDTWRIVSYKGKVYGIPVPQAAVNSLGLLTRTDWLDSLNLKAPSTVDDFYEVFKAIKTADPGGKDTIPYVAGAGGGDAFTNLHAFTGAFGIAVPYQEKNGSIVCSYILDEARDFLTYMNKLYSEQLLDQEYPVNKAENITQKLVDERAAMTTTSCWGSKYIIESVNEKNPSSDFTFIDLPTGPEGQSGFPQNPPVNWILVIPVYSDKAEEAVDLVNQYVSHPDLMDSVSFGIEGKHYNMEDGVVVPTEEAANIRWQVYYNLWASREAHFQRAKFKGFWPYYEAVHRYTTVPNMLDYAPPIAVVEEKAGALNDLVNENFIKIIAGALPISSFEDFVASWKSLGGEETLKALNDWYASTQ